MAAEARWIVVLALTLAVASRPSALAQEGAPDAGHQRRDRIRQTLRQREAEFQTLTWPCRYECGEAFSDYRDTVQRLLLTAFDVDSLAGAVGLLGAALFFTRFGRS